MEDSSSEEILSSDDGIVQKRCYMCIFPGNKAILKACTDKTWSRFIEFVPQWMNYDGNQSQIANNYARERVCSAEFSRHDNGNVPSTITMPADAGFHQKC